MNIINYIEHHPLVALVVTSGHLMASYALHNIEIPNIIMQAFQLGAWSVTITVGLISIIGAYKKWRKRA